VRSISKISVFIRRWSEAEYVPVLKFYLTLHLISFTAAEKTVYTTKYFRASKYSVPNITKAFAQEVFL